MLLSLSLADILLGETFCFNVDLMKRLSGACVIWDVTNDLIINSNISARTGVCPERIRNFCLLIPATIYLRISDVSYNNNHCSPLWDKTTSLYSCDLHSLRNNVIYDLNYYMFFSYFLTTFFLEEVASDFPSKFIIIFSRNVYSKNNWEI